MNTYKITGYSRHTLGQKRVSSVAVKLTKEEQKEASVSKWLKQVRLSPFELPKYSYICIISRILLVFLRMPEGFNMK